MATPPPPTRSSLAIAAAVGLLLLLLLLLVPPTQSKHPNHVIRFRSPGLRPSSLAYDPFSQHFLVSSLSSPSILSVSDAGVSQSLLSFPSPTYSSSLALSLDSHRRRLLAVLPSPSGTPALAAVSLPSLRTIFLSPFPAHSSPSSTAVDFHGNAYVADPHRGLIYRVPESGDPPSVFSNSSSFLPSGPDGLAFVGNGYLLAVQSSTGRMYKVDDADGTARRVLLSRDLPGAISVAVRGDGTAVVASPGRVWYVKSGDGWGEGAVYEEVGLEAEEGREARGVAVGRDDRVYVLYSGEGDEAAIEEVRSRREEEEEEGGGLWVYALVGFGMVYFTIWRFQMRKLVGSLDKKTN